MTIRLEPSTLHQTPPQTLARGENERAALARRARTTRWLGRASLALPVVGAAAGIWLLSRGPQRRAAALGTLGTSLGLGLLRWQLQRFVTEEVTYELEATLGDIEFRSYPAQVWAETVVEQGSWNDALSEGFRRLAGYIFGDNERRERLSMTAPVLSSLSRSTQQDAPARGERLSMTAPVLATLGEDAAAGRIVSFVMPADRSLEDLPRPKDPRVRLRQIPDRLVAVLPFRGDYRSGLPVEKREEMLSRLRAAGIKPLGEASFAGYDPPTTLPALRRNEILVELEDDRGLLPAGAGS